MRKSRASCPPQFRVEAVQLLKDSGKPIKQVAQDLGICVDTLRNWVKQAEIDGGRREGLTTSEREEIRRQRRGNKIIREEREILKKQRPSFPRRTTGNDNCLPVYRSREGQL